MHRHEIERIAVKVREKGYTIVPTKVYFKDGRAKVEIGLARGKKLYDKRHDMADKDAKRDMRACPARPRGRQAVGAGASSSRRPEGREGGARWTR